MWTPDQPFTNLRMQHEAEHAHVYDLKESAMTHQHVKQAILAVIAKAYDDALAESEQEQLTKPALLKHADAQLDKALRPFFT